MAGGLNFFPRVSRTELLHRKEHIGEHLNAILKSYSKAHCEKKISSKRSNSENKLNNPYFFIYANSVYYTHIDK